MLMSIYEKENPQWFRRAVHSVLQQTVMPEEIVIVQDGKLTDALYKVCNELKRAYPEIITFVPLEKNVGLGKALQIGVRACRNELIARMDADDISSPQRFEQQLKEFHRYKALALCGGQIVEFIGDENHEVSTRTVPLTNMEIRIYAKKRNPFNHMTVMFRKKDVIAAGNYQTMPLLEDYYLWVRMLCKNVLCKNIPEILVKARVGKGMYKRRGGWRYFMAERALYQAFYELGFLRKRELYFNLMIRFGIRLLPNWAREFIYKYVLRKYVGDM